MKKIFLFIAIFGSIFTVTYFSLKFFNTKKSEVYDTSKLSTATINNINVETTGVILSGEGNTELAVKEGIKLLGEGTIKTESFRIRMPGNGSIEVILNTPYDLSKVAFIKWLTENGYSHLDPTQFNYSYSEQ